MGLGSPAGLCVGRMSMASEQTGSVESGGIPRSAGWGGLPCVPGVPLGLPGLHPVHHILDTLGTPSVGSAGRGFVCPL